MSSNKRTVILNSGLYTFSSVLIKASGFLLLPVYTSLLTPNDYGIMNLVTSFANVFSIIILMSLHSAINRFYIDYKENLEKLKTYYGTIVLFTLFNGFLFFLLSMIFRNQLSYFFFSGISYFPIILIVIINLIFSVHHLLHQNIMVAMQNGNKYTKVNIVFFLMDTLVVLLFIGFFKMGVLGYLIAKMITSILYFIYMIIDLLKNNLIKFYFDYKILKEVLKYSIPIIPHDLSTSIATWISRLLLNNNSSLGIVGLYGVATQFGGIIDVVQASVNRAFAPWFFELMSQGGNNSKKNIVKFSELLLVGYSLIYMIIGLFSQEVLLIMTNENYVMAWTPIPILVIGYSIKSIYYFYINILFYYKKASNKIFIATVLGSFADIFLAYLLVPKYQMYGSAVAFMIAKIIVVMIVVFISEKYDKIGYSVINMLKIILPSLLFMMIGLFFSYTRYTTVLNLKNFIFKLIIFILYLIYLIIIQRKKISFLFNFKK